MGVAVSTIEIRGSRRWREFDWQLTLYLLLLIGFGVVLGISAAWNDGAAPEVIPQPVKTVVWTIVGFSLMLVAASVVVVVVVTALACGVARTAIGGDHGGGSLGPARPGKVEPDSIGRIAVRKHDHLHGRRCYCARPGTTARR